MRRLILLCGVAEVLCLVFWAVACGRNIDPSAVGLSMEGPSPRLDRFLRERSQTADVVARLRVNTVTVDSLGDDQTYHLGVQVGVPTLSKPRIDDRTFELVIRSSNRAF